MWLSIFDHGLSEMSIFETVTDSGKKNTSLIISNDMVMINPAVSNWCDAAHYA